MSHVLKVLAVALVVGVGIHACNGASESPHVESAGERMTREANDKAQTDSFAHIHRAVAGVRTLKAIMRDPDSFKVASVSYKANGDVCIEYRSRNGMGGMNSGYALLPHERDALMVDGKRETTVAWNKRCAGTTGEDLTDAVGNYKL